MRHNIASFVKIRFVGKNYKISSPFTLCINVIVNSCLAVSSAGLELTHQGSPVEYYSAMKTNKIVSLLESWMDLERVIQRRESEREKQRLNIHVYMWDGEEWHR